MIPSSTRKTKYYKLVAVLELCCRSYMRNWTLNIYTKAAGRDSAVGTATGCGMDGPRILSQRRPG